MANKIQNEIFLIINRTRLDIIKEIKQQLLNYNLKVKIYQSEDSLKSLLTGDIIVILDNELMLNHEILSIIEHLVLKRRAVHLFKLENVDVDDLKVFFNIDKNYTIKEYNPNQENFFMDLILSLKTFKSYYNSLNRTLDRICSKDKNFIKIFSCYINDNIKEKEQILDLVPISTKEYFHYKNIFNSLYIYNMTKEQLKEYLPISYSQVFVKPRNKITLNDVFNKIYFMKDELDKLLENISIDELNYQYKALIEAIKLKKLIDNLIIKLFKELGLIRIIDNEIKSIFPEKDLFKIKTYLENKFLNHDLILHKTINEQIYINYCFEHRLNLFNDFHRQSKLLITNNLKESDIVVSLVTTKSLLDKKFNEILLEAAKLNKKMLLVYLDKCELSLHMQYYLNYVDYMCYWAYKRYDVFFQRYFEVLYQISNTAFKEKKSFIS